MNGPFRVYRVPIWSPMVWGEKASPNRVADFVDWAHRTAEPKYGIDFGVHYTATLGAAELYDSKWFFSGFYFRAGDEAARFLGVKRGTEIIAHSRRAFDMWNSRYFILPYYARWDDENRGIASFLQHTERIDPPVDAFQGTEGKERELAWVKNHDYQVRRNLDAYPRAWVVHDARSLPAFRGLSRASRNLLMQEMLFSNDLSWPDPTRTVYDARRYVWLEDSVLPELAEYLSSVSVPPRVPNPRSGARRPQRARPRRARSRPRTPRDGRAGRRLLPRLDPDDRRPTCLGLPRQPHDARRGRRRGASYAGLHVPPRVVPQRPGRVLPGIRSARPSRALVSHPRPPADPGVNAGRKTALPQFARTR